MRKLLAIVAALLVTGSLKAEVFTGENRNDQFTVHGRLSVYNGSANLRIWIVGSKRILYIADDGTVLERINKFFGNGEGWFTRDVFADFTVEPLAPDIKGHMRPVRILAVKHVIVTKDGKVISKSDEL